MSFRKFAIAGALAAAASTPSAASAGVTITGIAGNPGFLTGTVQYSPGGIGGNPSRTSQALNVGRLQLTGFDNTTLRNVTFDSYCIDIFNYIQGGTFELQAFSLADPVKQGQIQRLLSGTASLIDSAAGSAAKKNVSAAIQMAVWEIVNESGTSGYSLTTGLFRMASSGTVNPTALGMAQGYLNTLDSFAETGRYRYRMLAAINPTNNQRQVFLAAVPEPSTWALFILGFGAVGGAMRSRRHRTAKFA